MHRSRLALILAVFPATFACTSAQVAPAPAPAPSPSTAAAPWSGVPVDAGTVAPAYLTAWRAADNRARCTLLVPRTVDGPGAGATPRTATFGGGWGVAYDLPTQRSAFGVAGTGASAWSGDVYDAWPNRRTYADGSRVGYGPEGGTGPNWLAYVRIPGQDCLYNVWSRLGQGHLEALLDELRFVTPQPVG